MTNELIKMLDSPRALEQLYQNKPGQFRAWLQEARTLYPDCETIHVWFARLSYVDTSRDSSRSTLPAVIILSLLAGVMVKLPAFFSISPNWYYSRFVPLIVFAAVMAYFYPRICSRKIKITVVGGLLSCLFFALALPDNRYSDSIIMAQIHMPLVLSSILALAFMSGEWSRAEARLLYIRYVGETLIYSILLLLGGILLTALTLGLFSLIHLSIEQWYINYVVVFGLVASPLVATYLYDIVLGRASKLATIIANVFSPLLLLTVLVYLLAVLYQGKSPYSDRDFLILFNGLLITVWAITVFSISGTGNAKSSRLSDRINIALIAVTLIINAVALSAIVFRLSEYGITPNRVAVTGANVLIFIHLILILKAYIKYFKAPARQNQLNQAIANFLPCYSVWSLMVVAIVPILFDFR